MRKKVKESPLDRFPYDVQECMGLMEEIETNLMYAVGLDVSNGICVDYNENGIAVPFSIDGNTELCFPKNIYNGRNITPFDPVFNRKLASALINRLAVALAYDQSFNLKVKSLFIVSCMEEPTKIIAVARTYNNLDIMSNAFVNESICWIDLLFKILDQQYDYTEMLKLDSYILLIRELENAQ